MSDEYLEQLLDEVPQLHEVCNDVRTAHWYELGIQLQLNTVDLDNINDSAVTDKLSRMYDVWLNKRADTATRRSLLTALQTDHVGQKRIAVEYQEKLMTMAAEMREKAQLATNLPNLDDRVIPKEDHSLESLSAPEDISINIKIENNGPVTHEAHALKITGIQLNETLAENALKYRFSKDPYHLQVDRCVIEGDTAYLTFTNEQGVSDVMAQPPIDLLGCPIECTSVPIADVSAFQPPHSMPQVLLIKNIPDESPNLLNQSLQRQLILAGHTITSCIIDGNEAYVKFQDQISISQLLACPPDNSTILGHPVIYSSVDEDKMPLLPNSDDDDVDTSVVVVDGLPSDFPGLEEAFIVFLKNATKTQSNVSCEIKDGKAYIKYDDPTDVMKIAENPPNVPFIGNQLTYKITDDRVITEENHSLEPLLALEEISLSVKVNESNGGVSHEAYALKITGIQLNEALAENALKYRFGEAPYHLQVDCCVVEGDTAYLTFTSEQGVSDVMAQPPTNLLGCPIKCTSVRIADVSAFQPPHSMPQVLHIKNIPDESPNLLNQSLQRQLILAGHTITTCIIDGSEAYVKFQDQKSISQLLACPPDNSTILGHPVIYNSVDEDKMPLLPNSDDDVDTSIVVVDGLPSDFPGLEEAFLVFLKNATKTQSNFSCEIKNGKAYIKYDDPTDAKRIAENPPNVPFIGNQLTYKTMTEPITGSPVHLRIEHHRTSDLSDLSSTNKSSVKFQSHTKDLPPPDLPNLDDKVIPKEDHSLQSVLATGGISINVKNESNGPVSCEAHALKITGIQLNETLAENALKYCFSKDPYHLQVDRCVIEGDTAYLTFTSEQGVSDVMAQPPTDLLGCPIECKSVRIADVSAFQPPHSMPQVLHIKNIPDESPNLLNQSLQRQLILAGHTITTCVIDGSEAYVKFQDQKSISQLLACPPDNSTILGHPVIYSSVDEDEMPLLPNSDDDVDTSLVVVDGLPSDFPGLEEAFLVFLKNATKTQSNFSCEIKDGKAYIKYDDPTDAKKIAKNPPNVPFIGNQLTYKIMTEPVLPSDSNTVLGHPVIYSSVDEDKIPLSPNSDDDVDTSVVVVDGLPSDFPGLEEAFLVFLKNATKTQSNFSCEIKDGKAYIKYDDPTDAKKIAENPPNVPFIGNQLTYKTMTEPISGSPLHPRLKHHASDPTDLSSMNKSPVKFLSLEEDLPPSDEVEKESHPSSVPNPTTPCTTSCSGTIVVKNIPDGVKDWVLELYLQNLTGVSCQKSHMKGAMAVVEMKEKIDVKSMRYKASISPLPEDNVILNIEALKPTTSVLIKGPEDMASYVVDMYCEGFGEIIEKKEHGPGEYVVSFRDKDSHQKILDQEIHLLGTQPLTITSYHPILAEIEQIDSVSSDTPPLILLSPNDAYTWPSIREQIAPESESYYIHALKEMNNDLLAIYGEALIHQGCLEIKPLELAHTLIDWNFQVHAVLSKYKQHLQNVELPIEPQAITMVLDRLAEFKETNRDLHYSLASGVLKMAGHTQSVRAATEVINNILTEEIEFSIDIERPPREIEYLLKFSQNEIEAIQPPVKIITKNPGKLSACGVKKSLECVKQIAEEKLSQVHTENILLTQAAYSLLSSHQGKDKIAEQLQEMMKSVTYVFEKIEQREEYTHQLCILSSDSVSCSTAKRKIEQIDSFLDVQNTITEEFPVKGAKWQIITEQQLLKLKQLEEDAGKMKVKLEFPTKIGDNYEVFIILQGDVKSVDNIKGQLEMMLVEVIEKEVPLEPEPGLHQLIAQGFFDEKCCELEFQHKVVIKYESKEVTPTPARSSTDTLKNAIKLYKGNMLDLEVDVYINFTNPSFDLSTNEMSKKLRKICGQKLVDEAQKYMNSLVEIKPSQVAVTTADNTNAKAIYHVALPQYSDVGPMKWLRETIQNILQTAKAYGHKSIAFPCLGATNLCYPTSETVPVVLEEVVSFHINNPDVITCFHFTVYQDSDYKHYISEYKKKIELVDQITNQPPAIMSGYTQGSQRKGLQSGVTRNGEGFKVQLLLGDITAEETEVIVTNSICKVIHATVEQDLSIASQLFIDQNVLLKDGMIVSTTASGILRCNKIYHTHVPSKLKGVPPTQAQNNLLQKVVFNCLKLAEGEGQISLAMPAFCLDDGNYTVPESAKPTLDAIKEFAKTNPTNLKNVRIVIFSDRLYGQYYDYFCEYFADIGSSTSQSPYGLFKLPQPQKNGVYAVIAPQTVFRPSFATIVPPQGKPNLKKCKIIFKIYGLVQQTLTIVEKELKAFVYEKIIHDMVDLGETVNVLTELDYVEMDELGEENGVEISIQPELSRVLVKGDERSVERVCHKIQMKVVTMSRLINDLRVYEWSSQGDDGMLKLYNPEISKQLEATYQHNQHVLELMIGDVMCIVDFNAMEERDVTGVTRAISRTRKMITDYPHAWNLKDMGTKVVHFESIDATSNEYALATGRFFETKGNSNYEIVKLQRIQNPSEYTRYQTLKKTWVMLHGQGNVTEKDLFHGAKKESVDPICSMGFNRGFSADANAALYGKGVYFALYASFSLSDKFSCVDSDGYKHILVCSLLVCKFTQGNDKMRIPPALPDNPQITYDTLVENETAPTIFVAMKDSQAYPKYWLTVKKV